MGWAHGVCVPVPEHERLPYEMARTGSCDPWERDCVESSYRVCSAQHGVADLRLEDLTGEWFEVAHRLTFWNRLTRLGATDARVNIALDAQAQQLRLDHSAQRNGTTKRAKRTLEWPRGRPWGSSGHLRMCRWSLINEHCSDVVVWEVAVDGSYFVMGDASGDNVTIYGRAPQLPEGEVSCLLERLVDAHCFLHSVRQAKLEPHSSPR